MLRKNLSHRPIAFARLVRPARARLLPLATCVVVTLAGVGFAAADEAGPQEERSAPVDEPTKDAATTGVRGIAWAESFEVAVSTSKTSERPLLVDFGAEWCGWCKKLDRETFQDARVIEFVSEFFVAVKVDTDHRKDLGTRFGVQGLPTLLVLSPDGKVLQKLSGFRPPETFLDEIRKSAESSRKLSELRDLAAKSPEDLDAQRAYARAIFAAGSAAEAASVLEAARVHHPEHPGLLRDLADLLRAERRTAEARAIYERLLALPRETGGAEAAAAALPLARLLIGAKDVAAARKHLDAFLQLETTDDERVEALFLRSYAFSILDEADLSVRDLETLVQLAPESALGRKALYILDVVERTR